MTIRALSILSAMLLCASCASAPERSGDPGEPAADEGSGIVIDTPDPAPSVDPCIDLDQCAGASVVDPGDASPEPSMAASTAGARFLLKTYSFLLKTPSAGA